MLIDWFTVTAQALNFLILVWLLKRFAYRPILQAINEREARIAAQLAAAAAAEAAASSQRETLARKRAELEQQRASLIQQMKTEAAALRTTLLEQARAEASSQRTALLEAVRADHAALQARLAAEVRTAVQELAGRTLRDLADVALNDAMVRVFLERLRSLSGADRQLLAGSAATAAATRVRTAFGLAPAAQDEIRAALGALSDPAPHLEFETDADLICGIELVAGGHRLAWAVSDYLVSLKAAVERVVAGAV